MLIQQLQSHLQHRKHVPLILCGDFNSEVDSAVYKLLSERYLRTDHPILKDSNAQKMLSYYQSFDHTLPLESAYAAIGEPKYTNYTGHYIGTLDYIWYSNGTLRPVAILEIDDEKHLKKQTALPSPQYPSDHIFLLAEFAWN
uniref:Endonuclease/exonuclease/phosphatase domain-containing protein n=2 Tax=Amorphochlora amoebiformis TaxID=1561963 RepID=A0A7S0CTS6_9EUKA|mmetsp:Transcript_13402/g.21223  ORF Transcript_13402/g.21223 Transcript_13402/m.21223 type:complete len:142 (+) Transcript_13402:40-465(+)